MEVRHETVISGCRCTLAQRTVGDGCTVCNPAKALEYSQENLTEFVQAVRDWLACSSLSERIPAYRCRALLELCDQFDTRRE